jgi:hypothetical protein
MIRWRFGDFMGNHSVKIPRFWSGGLLFSIPKKGVIDVIRTQREKRCPELSKSEWFYAKSLRTMGNWTNCPVFGGSIFGMYFDNLSTYRWVKQLAMFGWCVSKFVYMYGMYELFYVSMRPCIYLPYSTLWFNRMHEGAFNLWLSNHGNSSSLFKIKT